MSNMVKPTKDRGNYKKRLAIARDEEIMFKLENQKTISTHMVMELIKSLNEQKNTLKNRYQKLANKTHRENQALRKQIRELENMLVDREVSSE